MLDPVRETMREDLNSFQKRPDDQESDQDQYEEMMPYGSVKGSAEGSNLGCSGVEINNNNRKRTRSKSPMVK
jgi:hypothetical protein